jgi:DNA-binding transcriptional MerR regulator
MVHPQREFLLTSEVSRRCGVSSQTVRMWERTGVLPAAAKTSNGLRLFDRVDVERLARERAAAGR